MLLTTQGNASRRIPLKGDGGSSQKKMTSFKEDLFAAYRGTGL